MSKFNTRDKRRVTTVTSPILTPPQVPTTGHQGGPGFTRDARSELFLLAVANLGEKTFYESAKSRDARFESLVSTVAAADPDWMRGFLPWLRQGAGMRYAALVATGITVKTWLQAKIPGGRQLINSVLFRADEPGEFLAFWASRYFGQDLHARGSDGLVQSKHNVFPQPVKRGVGDAVKRLYNERNMLKWDTESHAWRFADVLAVTHPEPKATWQDAVFQYAIARRYDRPYLGAALRTVKANRELRAVDTNLPDLVASPGFSTKLAEAGFTWEDALSLWGGKVDKRLLWEAMIPNMFPLALIRNLRNFDEAGVSDQASMIVSDKLTKLDEKARLFPFQVLAAYKEAPSLRWAYPLQKCLDLTLSNVPQLSGRTLIMIDTSGSMNTMMTALGKMSFWETAVLFGVAVGARAQDADVWSYSDTSRQFPLVKGESVLKSLERFQKGRYFIGGGTNTYGCTNAAFHQGTMGKPLYDRVIILTDEQVGSFGFYGTTAFQIPASVPIYTWNLAGYRKGHSTSGADNRHTFGGLSDQAWGMIPLLEAGVSQKWPWLV